MGEIADDILNGILCQECGVLMGDIIKAFEEESEGKAVFINPPGYPRTCDDCKSEEGRRIYNVI